MQSALLAIVTATLLVICVSCGDRTSDDNGAEDNQRPHGTEVVPESSARSVPDLADEPTQLPIELRSEIWAVVVRRCQFLPARTRELDCLLLLGHDAETLGSQSIPRGGFVPRISMSQVDGRPATAVILGSTTLMSDESSFTVVELEVANRASGTHSIPLQAFRLQARAGGEHTPLSYAVEGSVYRSPKKPEEFALRFPPGEQHRLQLLFAMPSTEHTGLFLFPSFDRMPVPIGEARAESVSTE